MKCCFGLFLLRLSLSDQAVNKLHSGGVNLSLSLLEAVLLGNVNNDWLFICSGSDIDLLISPV